MNAQDWAGGAGLGGLALFVVLVIYRKILAAKLLSQLGRKQSYEVVRLLILVTAAISLAGLGAYTYLASLPKAVPVTRLSSQDDPVGALLGKVAGITAERASLSQAVNLYAKSPTAAHWQVVLDEMREKYALIKDAKKAIRDYNVALIRSGKRTLDWAGEMDRMTMDLHDKEAKLLEYLNHPVQPNSPDAVYHLQALMQTLAKWAERELKIVQAEADLDLLGTKR